MKRLHPLLGDLIFVVSIIAIAIVSVVVDMLTPDSVIHEKQQKDSLIRFQNQERRLRHKAERRQKHLPYVVIRFPQKDSIKNRFIVANTSLADIDSGEAIVFTHSWSRQSNSAEVFDTTKITLHHIPSGLRDTFSIQPIRIKMSFEIDSVSLVGLVFR